LTQGLAKETRDVLLTINSAFQVSDWPSRIRPLYPACAERKGSRCSNDPSPTAPRPRPVLAKGRACATIQQVALGSPFAHSTGLLFGDADHVRPLRKQLRLGAQQLAGAAPG